MKQKTLRCSECKGTNLSWEVYADEFDNIIDYSGSNTWCDDCYNHVDAEEIKARAIWKWIKK